MKFVRSFTSQYHYLAIAGFLCCATVQPAISQGVSTAPPLPTGLSASLWKSEHATHLIGLPDIKTNVDGTLILTPTEFSFILANGQASVPRAQITSVSVGDERREIGGLWGRIGRKAIPYGGGSALAMMTHKKVDLLTIEYRNENHAYHGVVFLLPRNEADQWRDMFPPTSIPLEATYPACLSDAAQPKTLKVLAITADGTPLPAEYRVLLYEHLLRRLQVNAGFERIVRDGDRSPAAACPSANLALAVNTFNKGNAVMRASTGPLGMFVGATSLKFHVLLQDDNSRTVFEKDIKVSKRGDSESLDIADSIAKTVTKKLKKLSRRERDASHDEQSHPNADKSVATP